MNQVISSLLISSSLIFPGVVEKDQEKELLVNNYLPEHVVNVNVFNQLKEKIEIKEVLKEEVKHILEERRLAELTRKAEEERLAELEKQRKEEESKWKTFEATYYSPFCPTGCIGITKTGYNVSNTIYYKGYRIIAVDPRIIPLYSIVEIKTPYESFKAVAIDVGSAIKNYRIDILVKSEKEAYRLGRHNIEVKIIGILKK